MPQYIKDWMNRNFLVVSEFTQLKEAIDLLKQQNQTVLLIKNNDQLFGITTSLIKKIGINHLTDKVIEYAEPVKYYGCKEWTIQQCVSQIRKTNKDYLVIKEDDQIIGIITIEDLFITIQEFGWDNPFYA